MAIASSSWVASANDPESDFPIQNLPYGVFLYRETAHLGVAIGDQILDLYTCADHGLLSSLSREVVSACRARTLNPLMSLGRDAWSALRRQLMALLDAGYEKKRDVEALLIPMKDAIMRLPVDIGDYTDFYASIYHATRVGSLFRPDNPLLPNYKYVPIGYHGRVSSIVISGSEIRRPCGQTKAAAAEAPVFGPSKSLDYELEIGILVGTGNSPGHSIPIDKAEEHIFGLCLVNDWSARDIQSWEYQPLGPFLAKNFATTISPWVVPLEALSPYRVPAFERPADDPAPLPYLASSSREKDGIDLTLEVYLQSEAMRQQQMPAMILSRGNLRDLYWTIGQLVTHHTCNGCNLRPGDLLATGTISGPAAGSEGCLLEKRQNPEPLRLPTGETRTFLEDDDEIIFRAYTQRSGLPRIGFGDCTGRVVASQACE
ncbi:fumarylacetoacetase [Terriglobus albidus]|uniref:fumarylacetoacetase n=1 Tax=Terriglobus albidus TaxID=1592106 RepID=UPI0021E06D5B|nr:fumarylacetoacetase [Terriglobus albidus]